jgi:hypothetical protein
VMKASEVSLRGSLRLTTLAMSGFPVSRTTCILAPLRIQEGR